uniref:Uncharacterized protein n=1 Tax=Cucumis melo TaxID=3656 RepID=A0A9I9CK18_CUCME
MGRRRECRTPDALHIGGWRGSAIGHSRCPLHASTIGIAQHVPRVSGIDYSRRGEVLLPDAFCALGVSAQFIF